MSSLGDNLASHFDSEVLELCEKHKIKFITLPPNSTHITQPLDLSLFGPLKTCFRKQLTAFRQQNPGEGTMSKEAFTTLLGQTLEEGCARPIASI